MPMPQPKRKAALVPVHVELDLGGLQQQQQQQHHGGAILPPIQESSSFYSGGGPFAQYSEGQRNQQEVGMPQQQRKKRESRSIDGGHGSNLPDAAGVSGGGGGLPPQGSLASLPSLIAPAGSVGMGGLLIPERSSLLHNGGGSGAISPGMPSAQAWLQKQRQAGLDMTMTAYESFVTQIFDPNGNRSLPDIAAEKSGHQGNQGAGEATRWEQRTCSK